MKFYTGVGSRETPDDILEIMSKTAEKLASLGWTLRSGGAKGADQAFEKGAYNTQIFLPWDGYEGRWEKNGYFLIPDSSPSCQQAQQIAMELHPNWNACKQGARKMHTRNIFQVLGENLDTPSKMLIAWTPLTKKGEPTGGTATAIRLAQKYGVEVFNLRREEDLERIRAFISSAT